MNKRAITLGLLVLLLAIQWPLWFGKGGWLRVRELERDLNSQNAVNEELRLRNQKLRSEVASLRDGVEAIEERARYDLGMVGNDEVYVQIVSPVIGSDALSPTSSANSPTPQPAAAKPAGAGGSNNTGNKSVR